MLVLENYAPFGKKYRNYASTFYFNFVQTSQMQQTSKRQTFLSYLHLETLRVHNINSLTITVVLTIPMIDECRKVNHWGKKKTSDNDKNSNSYTPSTRTPSWVASCSYAHASRKSWVTSCGNQVNGGKSRRKFILLLA